MSKVGEFLRARAHAFAYDEVSSRPIALVRIMTGLLIFYEIGVPWAGHNMDGQLATLLLSWVVFISTALVLVGYKTRWSTIALLLSFGIMHLYFGRWLWMAGWLGKPIQTFQTIVILAIAPSGRSLSIDRAHEVRRARAEGRAPEAETLPYWMMDLLALEIVALYFWPARDKTDAAWFRGERMEHYYMNWYGGSDSLVYTPWYHTFAVVTAWATTTSEFVLAFGLIIRKTRPYVAWLGVMLHVGILFTLAVTYFSLKMIAVNIGCMSAAGIHRLISRITHDPDAEPDGAARGSPPVEARAPS